LQLGISEANYLSVDMGVAAEGEYGDRDEFGYGDAIEEPGDPMIVDLEPIQALNNEIYQSGEASDREDNVDGSSDSKSADVENIVDEQPTEFPYGQNEYFPNHHFFNLPDAAQVHIDEPDNEWYPFDSRVDAVLF
jgi:hypothetical protein